MKLSYSSISAYQSCPLQYRFKYVECRPEAPSPSLSFGTSLHDALQWFHSGPTPDPPQLSELMDRLEACWVSKGYASAEEEARYFYQARSALELYYRRNVLEGEFSVPAALEHYFRIDLGFCELSGVIDRLDRDLEGGFEVIDYKTNRRLPPARRLREDLQLPIYHIAAQKIWDVPVSRVTFYYLLLDHLHSYIVTPEREREALAEIERVASSIESGRFEPRRNNLCPWCDYLDDCPLMAGTTSRKSAPRPFPLEVGQAVDEYVDTARLLEQVARRRKGLEDLIKRYLCDKGAKRIGGSRCVLVLDENGNLAQDDEAGA